MKIISITNENKTHPEVFCITVLAPDELFWKESPFLFEHEADKVYFLIGGGPERRLAGQANTQAERVKKAVEYLEGWLKECRAIGTLETRHNLTIWRDDPRGEGYFALQVWVWTKKDGVRHHKLFYFYYEEDTILYYLGYDEQPEKELVIFTYWDRKTQNEKELYIFPHTKDEAIYDAIDYLEWRLVNSQFYIVIPEPPY
jgi:hypothetical protein